MLDWQSVIIQSDVSLEEGIKVLNTGLRILLVVNNKKILIGIVNDGDIRRALIRKIPMDAKIKDVMNKNPVSISHPYSRNQVLNQMASQDLLHMPVINKSGEICGLETINNLLEKKSYDNPVFLMAGGLGTRLHPLTEDIPKPLLNVGANPLLEIILKQFIDAGFHDFFISVFYKADLIKKYFGDGSDWGVSIRYINESSPLGTAGSIGLLPDNLPNLPLIMMNGDLLTKVDFEHLLHFHNQSDAVATICVRQYDYQVPYGVVDVHDDYIIKISEKPFQHFLVNAGIYVLNRNLINMFDGKNHIDMPDFLCNEIVDEKVTAFPIHEYWLDIGHLKDYDKANEDIKTLNT